MTVSSVSTAPVNNYQNNPQAEFRQTFMQMVKAIKSGDLSGAQQAYTSLSQLQTGNQAPAAEPNSSFGQALSQVGQALQNGDIGGAQQALDALGQQMKSAHHHHHHHRAAPNNAAATTASSATGSANANSIDVRA